MQKNYRILYDYCSEHIAVEVEWYDISLENCPFGNAGSNPVNRVNLAVVDIWNIIRLESGPFGKAGSIPVNCVFLNFFIKHIQNFQLYLYILNIIFNIKID